MEEEVIKETKNILKTIGVKANWKGYKWWITAVIYRLSNDEIRMGELYEHIAKKHKTTASKAERALRYAVLESTANGYFKVNYKLSNSAFLELISEKIIDLLSE